MTMPDRPLTLKELIHELTAEYTMADEPVFVSGWDSAGGHVTYAVVGISVRMWHGKSVQSLKLCSVDEYDTAPRQPGQVPPGHPDAGKPVGWGEHPRDCDCGDCP